MARTWSENMSQYYPTDEERIANALERIADSLEKIAMVVVNNGQSNG